MVKSLMPQPPQPDFDDIIEMVEWVIDLFR